MRAPIRTQRALLTLIALLAAMAIPASPAAAALFHVDDDSVAPAAGCGTAAAPCPTLASAASRTSAGDVVVIASGDYDGASFGADVELRGANAGQPGTQRGLGAPAATRVHGTLLATAGIRIDGIDFSGVDAGAAIHLTSPAAGTALGRSWVRNSTFTDLGTGRAVRVEADISSLMVAGNLFAGDGASGPAIVIEGGQPEGAGGVVVEANELRGAGLAIANAAAAVIRGNLVEETRTPAVELGSGVRTATISGNTMQGGTTAAIRIDDGFGVGPSRGISITGNSISGFPRALEASGGTLTGTTVVRGNRIVRITGAVVVNDAAEALVDARGNWWGASSGIASSAASGAVDVGEPLRLVGVDAPAAVMLRGSGIVSVRLVGPVGGSAEPTASGFAAAFTAPGATLDDATVRFRGGVASTLVHASSTSGSFTTTVTLDDERVAATTRVLEASVPMPTGQATPTVAETPVPARARRLVARTRVVYRGLSRALSRGVRQVVTSNHRTSVRVTLMISPASARRLGLRSADSRTWERYIVGTARTRAIAGSRIVRVHLTPRAAYAINRSGRRVTILVLTRVIDRTGTTRRSIQRIVLPGNVR